MLCQTQQLPVTHFHLVLEFSRDTTRPAVTTDVTFFGRQSKDALLAKQVKPSSTWQRLDTEPVIWRVVINRLKEGSTRIKCWILDIKISFGPEKSPLVQFNTCYQPNQKEFIVDCQTLIQTCSYWTLHRQDKCLILAEYFEFFLNQQSMVANFEQSWCMLVNL